MRTEIHRVFIQNRRQKSSVGWLYICAGTLGVLNFIKTLIYSVSYYNLGGLELCLGGLNPQPPVVTGLLLLFSRWDGGMELLTILPHFPCTRVDSRFIFKNTVGQISICGKIGN